MIDMMIPQEITDHYALYNADCIEVLKELPHESIHLSIYSPPFAGANIAGGLYHYSSSERDLSNCVDYQQFFEHYAYVVEEITRTTLPGRMTAVHCMDVPSGNTGDDDLTDFPGDIIRLHQSQGWRYKARFCIWKEPLTVRNRTMTKSLSHRTIVEDSAYVSNAGADYLLIFQKRGHNPIPIAHPHGFLSYVGERAIPAELLRYRGWAGKQTENRFSHWIFRQYASSFWDDIRLDRVLPYREARAEEDEKHVHPLQLDVIERAIALYSNTGETILSPFMGVGSEIYGAVINGRRGVGIELKPSYFRQAQKNLLYAAQCNYQASEQGALALESEPGGMDE